jgi:hypothetical protein
MNDNCRNSDSAHDLEVMDSGQMTATLPQSGKGRFADNAGITDEPKAARGLRSDWMGTEHVLQTYRGL